MTISTDSHAQATWDATYSAAELEVSVWARLPFVDLAVDTFSALDGAPVLELPCGGGRNTVPLARALPSVVGVDVSPGALDLSRRVLARQGIRNCVLLQADVGALPFADSIFGGVFCADLLGHLREPRVALAELLRVSHPQARLIVNFFGTEDSTRTAPGVEVAGADAVLYRNVYFRYDDIAAVRRIIDMPGVRLVSLKQLRWTEGPHRGYRDYTHEHHGFIAVLERMS